MSGNNIVTPARAFPRRHLFLVAGSTLALVQACKKGPSSCMHVDGLSAPEIELRKTLEYVDQTPVAAQTCDKCIQWIPPEDADRCGGCKVMKGPVHPQGHCKVFAPK